MMTDRLLHRIYIKKNTKLERGITINISFARNYRLVTILSSQKVSEFLKEKKILPPVIIFQIKFIQSGNHKFLPS